MRKATVIVVALGLMAGSAGASQYPMVDKMAAKIVGEYKSSSCDQLAAKQKAPKDAKKEAMAEKLGDAMQKDPQMRAAFVNQVAAPIVDKMVACGFVP